MPTLPSLSTDQMREVDRLMIEEYHIELLQMMENAGRSLALLAKWMLDGDVADRPVVVLAGQGNNGGGGLVAARHLLNWGAWVQLLLTHRPEEYRGVAAHQLSILQAMDAPLAWAEEGWELPPADLKLREDLRTRLGWGHVFQLQVLSEPERRAVLRQEADARGIFLGDDVMDFMLTRFSRDLGSLMQLLDQLDSYALQTKRAITIPLIKSMLENE